jgi:hypothetical protein
MGREGWGWGWRQQRVCVILHDSSLKTLKLARRQRQDRHHRRLNHLTTLYHVPQQAYREQSRPRGSRGWGGHAPGSREKGRSKGVVNTWSALDTRRPLTVEPLRPTRRRRDPEAPPAPAPPPLPVVPGPSGARANTNPAARLRAAHSSWLLVAMRCTNARRESSREMEPESMRSHSKDRMRAISG